jgi:hypothetical protein
VAKDRVEMVAAEMRGAAEIHCKSIGSRPKGGEAETDAASFLVPQGAALWRTDGDVKVKAIKRLGLVWSRPLHDAVGGALGGGYRLRAPGNAGTTYHHSLPEWQQPDVSQVTTETIQDKW